MTIHVEIEEPIEPTLQAIRAAGRAAGLCVKPKTAALGARAVPAAARHRDGHDRRARLRRPVVHDRRREGQAARRRASILSHKLHGGEVHVDGGVNRDTAELVGGLGVDILVVGSALWLKGRDMGREIRLIRALADEGYQYSLNKGVPPIPRDRMVTFATLRRPQARQPPRRGRGGRASRCCSSAPARTRPTWTTRSVAGTC